MLTEIMSSESDEGEIQTNRSDSSGSDENDGTPDQWSVPSMSQSMLNKFSKFPDHSTKSKQLNSSKVNTEFVSSLSRVHSIPPPVPPKTFKQKRDSFENPMEIEEKSNSEENDQNQPFEEGNSNDKKMSVKDRARMLDQQQESDRSQSMEHPPGPNPFEALKRPAECSLDIEDPSTKRPGIVTESNVDTGQVETKSDMEKPMQEAKIQSQSHSDGTDLSTNEPSNLPTGSEPVSTGMSYLEQGGSSPRQHQGHTGPDRPSPWQHQGHPEPDRSSPWPHQHHANAQYPGPRSAHGWPGTPPPHGQLRYAHPHQNPGTPQTTAPLRYPHHPQNQGTPPPSGQVRYGYPHQGTPPSSGQVRYGQPNQYPEMGYGHPPQHAPPYGASPHQTGFQQHGYLPNQMQFLPQEGHSGPGGSPYFDQNYPHRPPSGNFKGHDQQQSNPHKPTGPNKKQQPSHTSPRGNERTTSKSKIPSRQTPTGKDETPKPGTRPSTDTSPSKSNTKSGGGKQKPNQEKGAQRNKGPKVEAKTPDSSEPAPGKMYLCVSGIDTQQTNETFFNYIEAKSKVDVNYDESLRTVDEPEHAVVVFEERIDVAKLKSACTKKTLSDSSLKFEEIDPPRYIIASSEDKLTETDLKDYLTKKKKQEVVKVHTTEEGPITAKMKERSGVTEILKDTKIKISGSKVVISVMHFCDHGTYWEKSLHRVAIPGPFKPSVSDIHIRSFIIDITSVCNEQLEQHHACLTFKDELYIECTIDPKDKMARQKVKEWKKNVQKAWEEFFNKNAKKRELQITSDTKDLLLEHINKTKDQHKSEELKVISPDETGSMKFVFVGRSKIVENFVDQVSTKKLEIEQELNRKKRIKTDSLKLKPIEIALMTKEGRFQQLKGIAPDFSCEPNEENGIVTFTGVEEDISKAKLRIFEIKNNFQYLRTRNLSPHQCQLLKNKAVSDMIYEKFNDYKNSFVMEIYDDYVTVCTTQDKLEKDFEKKLKDIVLEDRINLDDTSKDVVILDEWAEKKTSISNLLRDVVNIDDSRDDFIIVTATCDVFDSIKDELETFIKEHSTYEDEIQINEKAEFKFLQKHCNNWIKDLQVKNSDQNLKVDLAGHSVKISGTKKSIDSAKYEIKKKVGTIKKEKHVISKPGVNTLVSNTATTDTLFGQVEEDSGTIITVDLNTIKRGGDKKGRGIISTDEDYVLAEASNSYKRGLKDHKLRTGDQQLKKGPVVSKNGTKIILVRKEDLGKQKADVIICSTNGELNLSGPAGKSIVNVAGEEINVEIKNKYKDGIKHGEIAVVKGYKLQCKEVYLAALSGWAPGGEQMISKCVNTCLTNAASSSYKSIVFPALGTGNLHYPRDLVAKTMFECVCQFDKKNTSLKEIKFLCYDNDTIKAFETEEMRITNPNYQPTPVASSGPGYYKKHNISVTVKEGDLGQQQVDVLVSAVPKDLNLESAGGAGISLMKGLGGGVQQDIINQHPNGVNSGGFAAIKLTNPVGKCKTVYLSSLDSWDKEKNVAKEDDKQICKFVYQCLETAEKSGYKSIGIPAMGTGKIGYPHQLVAKYMYDTVEKFVNNHKSSKLTDVKFVVHVHDRKSKQAFTDEEKKRLPAPPKAGPHKFDTEDVYSDTSSIVVKPISDNDFQVGKIKFSVEKGDILSKSVDGILNGSNEELDLSKGAVSLAIKKKCNKDLETECSKKKDDMKKYEVVSTSGCGLPCKFIIHICSKHRPNDWKQVIKKALYKAEKKQLKTLAIPALGTGAAGNVEEEMGQTIMASVVEFVAEGKTTNLQHIYLVIFQDKMVKSMLKGVRTGGHTALSGDKQKQVIKSGNSAISSVTFWIHSMSSRETTEAKRLLEEVILDQYKTEQLHDRLLSELRPREMSYLKSVEDNYPITMTIDQVKNEIIIEGLTDDSISAKQDVFDWLRKFNQTRHCETEAEIVKEQAQWFLKDKDPATGLMELIPYPPMINMHLENAYKGTSSRTDVDFPDSKGNIYIIDLKSMTEYPKNDPSDKVDVIRREKIEGEGGTFEPPPEWTDQGTDNVKVVTLIKGSPEYLGVEKKFLDSVKTGRYSKHPEVINKTITVTKIERIQNLNLYRMYAAKRSLMEKQNPNLKNEQELWHGTPENAVVSINLYGFNRSYCTQNSQGAWWGQGVYFANDAGYSVRDFLTKPGASGASQERNMYLCLVLTGVSRKGVKNEPLRYLPIRTDGSNQPYDTNTDDLNPPLEFVIFNDTQAYPTYHMKFTLQ